MPKIAVERELLSLDSIKNLACLYEHIGAHEQTVAELEYDPIKSPRRMEPLLLKQCFDPTLLEEHVFFDLFEGISADAERAISGLFRVYIDGMLSPQYENEVLYAQPLLGESFEAFVSRATNGRKFGIVVNGAEQWSDTLARLAARVFAPVVEMQGVARSTIEVTLFIGNYGYTPFGIHIDDPYTSVVHFHAGPTTKEMTLFGIEEFHRLNGIRKNCFEPQKLIPHGRTFTIEPGDVFLLPPHYYHIGRTEGFSIGVACAISKYPDASIAKQVMQRAIDEERMRGPLDQVIVRTQTDGESLAAWLRRASNEYTAQTSSRRHLRYSFLRCTEPCMSPQHLWERDPDFPLSQLEEDDDLLLFVRGHRVRLARNEMTRRLVAALPYTAFSIVQLHRELDGVVSVDALSAVVRQLARLGGLRLAAEVKECSRLPDTSASHSLETDSMNIDATWARRLVSTSQHLSLPTHLPSVMPGYDQVRETIGAMFTRFTPEKLPRTRAWVDGGQRYTITDVLVDLANNPDLALQQRLAMASGSPHYCVTFNGLSAWCESFAQHMQVQMLDPLFAALDVAPVCGTDFYMFVGNYGFTPFGVHDDTDQSLLWHLGPAPKVAYVWPRARYIELTGGTLATTDYEALLPYAQRYELQPGDLLFIPMGDFHILETREFSCTMGLTIFPDDMRLECSEALRLLVPDERTLRAIAQAPITLEQWARLRRLAVQSNGYVITPPQLGAMPKAASDLVSLRRCVLRIHASCPLLTAEVASRQALFVRGRVIWGRPNSVFSHLCAALASGELVPFETLEQQLSDKVQAEALVELVCQIAALGGVQIAPR
ncbi:MULTISPECIES: hypothetical protein [unclassified Undibacterium]|uniref:hypothetical protein n=2 Tax=Undibacterium TaxID=401469 RepID=UPI002AC9F13E|nr:MULTISPECIES: hypothetical protein [unclassified Undibacterium]MEB0137684.1 cupin domain-containing protein [Undibacterium sp. CCC2.1]MEB0172664.1 cupin domain-containing protein [Undibacterium sp. CCC1.1]MEB0177597.1 cupin domain-containing protein [Undibacterium sp. CCC3.4]MEB0215459.1 cupin domain-containing protein [Undibacterium sp. 5I2]WPX42258.1 hypothetical protein RHM61_12735 [Undibacterium sp. CCC3.4]